MFKMASQNYIENILKLSIVEKLSYKARKKNSEFRQNAIIFENFLKCLILREINVCKKLLQIQENIIREHFQSHKFKVFTIFLHKHRYTYDMIFINMPNIGPQFILANLN